MTGDGSLTGQLQIMMQRRSLLLWNPTEPPHPTEYSQLEDEWISEERSSLPPHIFNCSAMDSPWAAGHSCPWWYCCAVTADITWAISGGLNCSPGRFHLVVYLALRWSCALKQSPQTKPFLWSFSVMWFVKIIYGSLLPTHCCSYLKTYLDGILQSLLKFAWITLLIFYCSTGIKWQAEMLIRLKFCSAMQVLLMF